MPGRRIGQPIWTERTEQASAMRSTVDRRVDTGSLAVADPSEPLARLVATARPPYAT